MWLQKLFVPIMLLYLKYLVSTTTLEELNNAK